MGVRSVFAQLAGERFVAEHRQLPTQDSWMAVRTSPCERTVRKRYGSVQAAAVAAVSGLPELKASENG